MEKLTWVGEVFLTKRDFFREANYPVFSPIAHFYPSRAYNFCYLKLPFSIVPFIEAFIKREHKRIVPENRLSAAPSFIAKNSDLLLHPLYHSSFISLFPFFDAFFDRSTYLFNYIQKGVIPIRPARDRDGIGRQKLQLTKRFVYPMGRS